MSPFYPQGASILLSLTSAASVAAQPSTAGVQGLTLTNLSTSNVFCQVSPSSAVSVTLPTTAAAQPGFWISYGKARTISSPPNPWLSACTTGAGLTALLAVEQGYGL